MLTNGRGSVLLEQPFAQISNVVIFGADNEDDTLSVQLGGDNPIPDGGLLYNGGAAGYDSLVVVGTGEQSARYNPDEKIFGDG